MVGNLYKHPAHFPPANQPFLHPRSGRHDLNWHKLPCEFIKAFQDLSSLKYYWLPGEQTDPMIIKWD
jgi:hypothetical protein